jgi:hypothetical protein
MDVIRKQLILLLCSTALLIASPFVDFRILALAGIIFSAPRFYLFSMEMVSFRHQLSSDLL